MRREKKRWGGGCNILPARPTARLTARLTACLTACLTARPPQSLPAGLVARPSPFLPAHPPGPLTSCSCTCLPSHFLPTCPPCPPCPPCPRADADSAHTGGVDSARNGETYSACNGRADSAHNGGVDSSPNGGVDTSSTHNDGWILVHQNSTPPPPPPYTHLQRLPPREQKLPGDIVTRLGALHATPVGSNGMFGSCVTVRIKPA